MKPFLANIKVFAKRLISTDWKQAGAELSLLSAATLAIIADVRAKNFGALINDFPAFWLPLGIVFGSLRMIFSSNVKAVENPALPQITEQVQKAPN